MYLYLYLYLIKRIWPQPWSEPLAQKVPDGLFVFFYEKKSEKFISVYSLKNIF